MEIEISSQKNAFELQNRISSICHGELRTVLDGVFSQLSGPGELHRISRLELDVGTLSPGFSDRLLMDKIEKAMKRDLGREIRAVKSKPLSAAHGKPEPASPSRNEAREAFHHPAGATKEPGGDEDEKRAREKTAGGRTRGTDMDLLQFFLETGALPWWADQSEKGVVVRAAKRLAESEPDDLRRVFQQSFFSAEGVKRAVLQFPDSVLENLLEMLLPDEGDREVLLVREMLEILPGKFRSAIWRAAFSSLMARLNEMASSGGMAEDLFLHAAKSGSMPSAAFFKKALERIRELEKAGFVFKSKAPKAAERLMKKAEGRSREPGGENQRSEAGGRRSEVGYQKSEAGKEMEGGDETTHPMPQMPKVGRDKFSDAEEMYIGNAGLVLLHDFLPGFFKTIGLLDNGVFASFEAARRAVLVLQYIVEEAVEASE